MKTRTFIVFAALCAGLFSSCAKEMQPSDNEEHPDYQVIEFQATTEMAKTTISGSGTSKTVQWAKGDAIDIFWNGGQTTAQASVAGATTTFRANVPSGVDLYASYPSGVGTFEGGELTVAIPSTVSGKFAEVNMLAAKINQNSGEATVFHNVASYLKFTVAGDANANKIYISSRHTGDGETPVFTGSWPLSFDANGNVTTGEATPDKKDITVMIDGNGDYYVPVIPDYVYPDGFTIMYYSGNVNTYSLEADFDFRLDKAYIANFGVVSSTFSPVKATKYYVTVSGAGQKDGSNWANAMGKNEFKTIITRWNGYDDANPTDAQRDTAKEKEASLNNATFYIAEGTYDFGEIVELGFSNHCKRSINFAFDGGYYNNGLKDPAGHPTVFSGGNSHNIFKISRYADFGAQDCVFANSLGSSGGDAAIWFEDSHGKLTLTNCVLRDNANTATAAAISIGKGSAHLIGCTFSGNTATYAPAINIDNSKSSVSYKDVIVENCTFDGNYASVEAGAIRCASGGPVTVSNSTFINNTTDTYGAVMVCSGAPATFTGCTFGTENNGNVSTKSGGVARVRTSEVTFDDCTFAYNEGQYGGAISMEGSNTPVVTVKDCHFLKCKTPTDASNKGGAIMQDAGTLTVTGSTFDDCSSKDGGVYSAAGGSASFSKCDFGKTTRNGASAGGGCFFFSNSVAPTFENCWISAYSWTGAGVRTEGSSHPSFTGCTFNNCTCNKGGAIYVVSTSYPSFTGCTFSNCKSDAEGGVVMSETTNNIVDFTNCTFTGNKAGDGKKGSVAYLQSTADTPSTFTGCAFTGNTISEDGTLYLKGSCGFTVTDCTFTGNSAGWGAGIFVGSATTGGVVEVSGCSFVNNVTPNTSGKGAAIYLQAGGKLHCNNSVFDGNSATGASSYGGAICYGGNDCLVYLNACSFKNNSWAQNYGSLIPILNKTNIIVAMNNCSGANNYSCGSPSNGQQCTWFNVELAATGKLIVANSSFIGDLGTKSGSIKGNSGSGPGIFRLNATSGNLNIYMINNILAKISGDTNYGIAANGSSNYTPALSVYNKAVFKYWKNGTGDYYNTQWPTGTNTYFGGIAWNDELNCWTWNGSGSAYTNLANTSAVNEYISDADSGFYAWLQQIGAISQDGTTAKDARGVTRAATSWPGSYQN